MEIYERHQNTNQILRFGPKELQTFRAINSTPNNFLSLFPLEFLVAFAERCKYESCTNIINLSQCGGIMELCFKFNNWLSFMQSPWQTTETRKLCFFSIVFHYVSSSVVWFLSIGCWHHFLSKWPLFSSGGEGQEEGNIFIYIKGSCQENVFLGTLFPLCHM